MEKPLLPKELMEWILIIKKRKMILFEDNIIDTPGEYIENKFYYKALTVTASNADIIAFVQSALDEDTLFHLNFLLCLQEKE